MYEQINQRAAQQAVEAKVAAMSQHGMNDRLRGQMIGETIGASALKDMPLMEVEYDRLSQSIGELDASVAQLIASIAPVCQPNGMGGAEKMQSSEGQKIESTPSELRSKLIGLRLRVEAISCMIAPVKFRIEI